MTNLRNSVSAAALAGLFFILGTAAASAAAPAAAPAPAASKDSFKPFQAGDFMVRLRGIDVAPTPSTDFVTVIGGHVSASSNVVPEIDLTYYFTPHIAVEAIAATSRHHVRVEGSSLGNGGDLGRVSVLPPTITAQYHFLPENKFNPYVGAGINYTYFYDHELPGGAVTSIHYSNGFHGALQVGADYNVAGNWFLNADLKYIYLGTSVKVNGGAIRADANLDPLVIGLGVGYRF